MPRERVSIKGTRQGLRILLDPEGEFEEVLQELEERLNSGNGFFTGASVDIYTGGRELRPEHWAALAELVGKRFGLRIGVIDQRRQPPEELPYGPVRNQGGEEAALADRVEPTLLVKRTLRSGQSVRFKGNVVIVGDVNPGAEVVATGDVIVIGVLRGMVHAGAAGNRAAVVTAFRLAPTQLRIADVITRAPDNASLPSVPEVARIKDGCVVIEEYVS
ncbi:MAG: septum site-determining protein MinC [Bacillota bacterium]|nr:septum site-determining protein MinC [Bacillota bacterium]